MRTAVAVPSADQTEGDAVTAGIEVPLLKQYVRQLSRGYIRILYNGRFRSNVVVAIPAYTWIPRTQKLNLRVRHAAVVVVVVAVVAVAVAVVAVAVAVDICFSRPFTDGQQWPRPALGCHGIRSAWPRGGPQSGLP